MNNTGAVVAGGSTVAGESRGGVLLVEDNPADARLIREMLGAVRSSRPEGEVPTDLEHVERFEDARAAVGEGTEVVLLDLDLPDTAGMETVERAVETFEGQAVVVLTGLDDERVGQEAIECGAQDFLVKDELDPRTLRRTIRYAVERERQQRELQRRAEKLAVLNWVLRHEIRDDMTVLVGRGRSLADHVDDRGRPQLEEMVSAGEDVIALTDTVRELLDALDDGGTAADEVALRPVLTDRVESARRTHDGAAVELVGEVPDATVAGTDLLGSVFRNLLSNAVRHNDRDEPTVTVTARVEDGSAVVEVADDGPGIPDARKGSVFDLNRHREGSPGTGVGLFLVETVVEQCGGTVELEDAEPRGSVFRVRLPVVE